MIIGFFFQDGLYQSKLPYVLRILRVLFTNEWIFNIIKSFFCIFLTVPDGSVGKKSACNAGDTDVDSVPGWGSTLEEEMAAHSSILA